MAPWENEFPQAPDLLYLNHAAVTPWPQRTADAVSRFAMENLHQGARYYPRWQALEAHLREQLRQLINAPSAQDIALLKNTSEGLSVIAEGLSWEEGDTVVITDQEFPSNRIPWQALARYGVRVVEAGLDVEDPEQAIIDALTSHRPRLLSVSSVQYGTGLRLDLARLGETCRRQKILFCVDAIQSLGVVPMDVQKIGADFVVADGHKWMLGPEGLALFYCHASLRESLTLHQHGWHMIDRAGDYGTNSWRPAADARRFECGSPNMLCAHALSASLSLLLEIGIEEVGQHVGSRIARLEEGLLARGMRVLSPRDPGRRAGILTFLPPGEPPENCFERLHSDGVVCALRGGGVRFSPHFYTPDSVIDRALAAL